MYFIMHIWMGHFKHCNTMNQFNEGVECLPYHESLEWGRHVAKFWPVKQLIRLGNSMHCSMADVNYLPCSSSSPTPAMRDIFNITKYFQPSLRLEHHCKSHAHAPSSRACFRLVSTSRFQLFTFNFVEPKIKTFKSRLNKLLFSEAIVQGT